ncbi:integral membrane protein [Metarhizium guizhouense ARSEF 977]|uniref:Integral membrane protein n=1 Tax=Metarhizium guizhouense (strain ARSEF 977) TaxID=1276136 RepID=A0A0B4IC11_METGA|nr:integral membrane protein [Metarhizium guizhouense ARSEF 977]
MAVGAFVEPLVVVALLFGGAWFNRNKEYDFREGRAAWESIDGTCKRSDEFCQPSSSQESLLSADDSWTKHPSPSINDVPTLRRRKIQLFGYKKTVASPNTLVFKHRFLSRVLQKFPFLVEAWYWVLIYWVYQLGRAFTAVTLVEDTVNVARRHALQVIHLEQRLHVFWEVPIQKWFMQHPALVHWINRVYSFIHIPGTIFFLVALYYITTTRKDRAMSHNVTAGPALYEARRRTMAMCNLLAFVVFTLWPCMPPRLLSDPGFDGDGAVEAKGFGFVDTVHSSDGQSSVWTTNRFCNQYAAMPSLHFGYSLLIGLTVATLPVSGVRATSWKRLSVIGLGMAYPALILTAIVATANHFILDAVAGAVVCGIAWNTNGLLLNLCVIEDYFLWMVRIHKPVNYTDPETAVETQFHSKIWSEA